MPSTFIATKEELETLVEEAVVNAVSKRVPEIVRKATRKEWLTTKETMELLDCSRRHLFHLRDTNQITFHQNGRKILFNIDDVEKYLEETKVKRRDN